MRRLVRVASRQSSPAFARMTSGWPCSGCATHVVHLVAEHEQLARRIDQVLGGVERHRHGQRDDVHGARLGAGRAYRCGPVGAGQPAGRATSRAGRGTAPDHAAGRTVVACPGAVAGTGTPGAPSPDRTGGLAGSPAPRVRTRARCRSSLVPRDSAGRPGSSRRRRRRTPRGRPAAAAGPPPAIAARVAVTVTGPVPGSTVRPTSASEVTAAGVWPPRSGSGRSGGSASVELTPSWSVS